jgi:hypothetical protein
MFNGLLYMPGVYWSMIREDGDEWERYVDEDTSMTIDQRLSLPRTISKMKSHVMIWERPDIVNRDARMLYYAGLPLHDMIHAFLYDTPANAEHARKRIWKRTRVVTS